MNRIPVAARLVLAALALAVAPAAAQDVGPSGKDVYDVACARCHDRGAGGAPRTGDRAAWAKRAEQGIGSLTRHALEGIRRMPAHGEDADLDDLEIRRATVYMVNQSGGNWLEPRGPGVPGGELSGAQVVQGQCY
jgi:cytochrome c5